MFRNYSVAERLAASQGGLKFHGVGVGSWHEALGKWRCSSTSLGLGARWKGNDELHAPAALPPRERAPGTHWIGGWVGPRVGLDAVSGIEPGPSFETLVD
jgi:hypothetical protein